MIILYCIINIEKCQFVMKMFLYRKKYSLETNYKKAKQNLLFYCDCYGKRGVLNLYVLSYLL